MYNFKQNFSKILTGTALSQAIILLMMPLLTTVIGPASFGVLALFSGAYGLLAGVLTMKYELSILLPKRDNVALMLTSLTIQLSALLSTILLLLLILGWVICDIPSYWLCLPICTFLASLYSSFQQWCARLCEYRFYSTSLVLGSCVNVMVCLILEKVLGDFSAILVIGFSLGLVASVFYVLLRERNIFKRLLVCSKSRLIIFLTVARQYREFPLYALPTSLVAGCIYYVPPLLLGVSYSLDVVGFYSIATKFVLLPGLLIGNAISEAFRAEIMARIRQSKPLANFTFSLFSKIAVMLMLVYALIVLSAPWLFNKFLGDGFEQSGAMVPFVALAGLGILISQPLQAIFIGLRRVRFWLILQLVLCIVPLLLLTFQMFKSSIEESLLWYSSSLLSISFVILIFARRLITAFDRKNGY